MSGAPNKNSAPQASAGAARAAGPAEALFPERADGLWDCPLFERLLMFLRERGVSDVVFSSGEPAHARAGGVWARATRRRFATSEIAELLNFTSGNRGASALILSGLEQDYSFEAGEKRSSRTRFRVNASAVMSGWGTGISLALRIVSAEPPPLESLNVEGDLARHLFPPNGLVLATGVMGSGKSTLLASVLRRIAEGGGRHICTYEAPVEFDLGRVSGRLGPCEQSEVPRHAESFAQAVRRLTRRAADVVLVGESRDPETMRGVLEASELGLAVYTTAHTRSVAETPTRVLNVFGARERRGLAAALFSSVRVIVQQRLLPKIGGGRHAVREHLAFDDPMRAELLRAKEKDLPLLLAAMTREKGQTLLQAAEKAEAEGLVPRAAVSAIRQERGK